jgi:4-amino-4-deoxy-L-arabinose transferase-like glycosyltransferase
MLNSSLFDKYAHSTIVLFCVIAVIVFKIPHLGLQFFWDEAWVYAPAVKLMGAGLPSLMPDSIPVDYTRGHPLIFHFMASCWLKIFGESNASLHSFALLISVLLLCSVYYFGKTIFNKNVAVVATILLSVQAVFLAQSSFLLPEIMLSLFVVLTTFCFLKEKKVGYILFGTALVLTKESGVILIASLAVWFFIDYLLVKKEGFKAVIFFRDLLILVLPVLIASVYFITQWKIHGWFFYPEHIGMINLSYDSFLSSFRKVYNFFFEDQGRKILTIGFVIIFLLFYKPLSFKWRVFLSFLMLACVKIFFGLWKLPPFLTMAVCGFIMVMLFYFLCLKKYVEKFSIQDKAICVFYIFTFSFLLFSSINFLSNRYLLCLIPFYTLTLSYFAYGAFVNNKWLFIVVSIFAIISSVYATATTKKSGDDNLSYVNIIALQKSVVSYMEEQNLYDENIHATFLNIHNLSSPVSGFLSGEQRFTRLTVGVNDSTRYAIIVNYEQDKWIGSIQKSESFKEIKRFENDIFWVKIYERK